MISMFKGSEFIFQISNAQSTFLCGSFVPELLTQHKYHYLSVNPYSQQSFNPPLAMSEISAHDIVHCVD